MELLGAFITGVVGPIAYFLINKYYQEKKDKKRDMVKETISKTSIINDELMEMKDKFKADRVWITQFHNGGNFYPTGKSIQKFSVFYEVAHSGISSVSHTFKNIPCSLYPNAFNHLMHGKGIFIKSFDGENETYGLKGAAQSVGTKSSYVIPLFTMDDKYIGNLGVDYVLEEKKLSKSEWEHLQIYSGRISGFLQTHLIND